MSVFSIVNAKYRGQKIGKNAVKPYKIRVCEGLGGLKKMGKNRGILGGLKCMLFSYKKLSKMVDKS